jgi:hypothetical protein
MEGVGLIHEAEAEFRASAAGLEDCLTNASTLHSYIEVQLEVAKSRLKSLEFHGPVEARMEGSDEALLLTVNSDAKEGVRVTQRQIYARSGDVVGILTMSGLPAMNQDFIEIVRGASFNKPQIPDQ